MASPLRLGADTVHGVVRSDNTEPVGMATVNTSSWICFSLSISFSVRYDALSTP